MLQQFRVGGVAYVLWHWKVIPGSLAPLIHGAPTILWQSTDGRIPILNRSTLITLIAGYSAL